MNRKTLIVLLTITAFAAIVLQSCGGGGSNGSVVYDPNKKHTLTVVGSGG